MRNDLQSAVKLLICRFDSPSAVQVKRCAKFLGSGGEGNVFAINRFARFLFLPPEKGREFSRIHKGVRTRDSCSLRVHRTFTTTSVLSSESGALCANHSTSLNIKSESSVADSSWWLSIILRRRSVPKNCPSLFVVSAIPSEWKTTMFPCSSVTPHSS